MRETTRETSRKLFAVIAMVAVIGASGFAPSAARAEDEQMAEEGGFGALAALCSLVYAPAKLVYAVGGGLIGGLAWVFSAGDAEVANAVITPSIRGDYVVTPSHLRGQEPLEFIGRDPAYSEDSTADVASDGGW